MAMLKDLKVGDMVSLYSFDEMISMAEVIGCEVRRFDGGDMGVYTKPRNVFSSYLLINSSEGQILSRFNNVAKIVAIDEDYPKLPLTLELGDSEEGKKMYRMPAELVKAVLITEKPQEIPLNVTNQINAECTKVHKVVSSYREEQFNNMKQAMDLIEHTKIQLFDLGITYSINKDGKIVLENDIMITILK